MENKKGLRSKSAMLSMELSTFEVPPSGDVLVLGKCAPLGPEAAKRVLDSVAPGQFELLRQEDDVLDAIFCRKNLFLRAEREALIKASVEEARAIMSPECMIAGKCELIVSLKRSL